MRLIVAPSIFYFDYATVYSSSDAFMVGLNRFSHNFLVGSAPEVGYWRAVSASQVNYFPTVCSHLLDFSLTNVCFWGCFLSLVRMVLLPPTSVKSKNTVFSSDFAYVVISSRQKSDF